MADNTTINSGSGGDTIRGKDRTSAKTQIVALDLNPAGAETLMGGTMPVSAASLPLPASAAQEHATAGSPHSARLSDGTTYIGSTAQRLHVDDGGSSISVDDNGGSLTVDQATAANLNALAAQGAPAAQANAWFVRPRSLATYAATYRLAAATAGQVSLTFTFTANTEKQLATIYHTGASAKTVRLRKASVVVSTGAAGVFGFELKRLSATTAPATGNPAITPAAFDSSNAAAEAACLALPTTAGSLSATDSPLTPHFEWNSAAGTATANPSGLAGEEIVLYQAEAMDEEQQLTLRSGVAEGFAIVGRSTTAVALRYTAYLIFTEE